LVHFYDLFLNTFSYSCQRYVIPWIRDLFPISKWLPLYTPSNGLNDFIAGMAVGLTVIPQGLAYASIARLPAAMGLYSAFMGPFIYCIFGTSKDISLGPTAIMSAKVFRFKPIKREINVNNA